MAKTWYVLLIIAVHSIEIFAENKCELRNYTYGGVCVCNSTYCDTIDPVKKVEHVSIYTTNDANLRFEKTTANFTDDNGNSTNEIVVDRTIVYQEIVGFGGAFTDATGINIQSLDAGAQENLMKSYFSEEGIEYSLCRVPIGATDFSTRGYTYAEEEDKELNNFKLVDDDYNYKIPFITWAQNLTENKLRLFASAWTAPKWIKINENYSGIFGFIKFEFYDTWARYFVKFLDHYLNEGISFWGITTGNEPSLALTPITINSVAWLPLGMATWVGNFLGPHLRSSNHSDIKLMMLDDQRFALPWFPDIVLFFEKARKYIDGIAVHWYWDSNFSIDLVNQTHNNHPDKFLLSTEACNGDKPGQVHVALGSWERGEKYAKSIIEDNNYWIGGWIDWNMALNTEGGPTYIGNLVDSPIIVNDTSGEFYKQPTFYCLGHFSKFVPVGSHRIYSTIFDDNIPVTAYKRPDNGIVVVILNTKYSKVQLNIYDETTSKSLPLTVSPKSITTILYW